jgi:hypothetical protein
MSQLKLTRGILCSILDSFLCSYDLIRVICPTCGCFEDYEVFAESYAIV